MLRRRQKTNSHINQVEPKPLSANSRTGTGNWQSLSRFDVSGRCKAEKRQLVGDFAEIRVKKEDEQKNIRKMVARCRHLYNETVVRSIRVVGR